MFTPPRREYVPDLNQKEIYEKKKRSVEEQTGKYSLPPKKLFKN